MLTTAEKIIFALLILATAAAFFVPIIRRIRIILAGAPEGERYAREMCPWEDVRNIKEFACVSVPEEIDYPLARFSSLKEIVGETLRGGKRLAVVGKWDVPGPIFDRVLNAAEGLAPDKNARMCALLLLGSVRPSRNPGLPLIPSRFGLSPSAPSTTPLVPPSFQRPRCRDPVNTTAPARHCPNP